MISRRILLLAVGCAFFGALILLELGGPMTRPVPPVTVSARLDSEPTVSSDVGADPNQLASAILARPLFSSTRRPPPTGTNEISNNFDLGGARLTGIVIAPEERLAMFDIKGSKPVVVKEGETVSGWRVESITWNEVALIGPGGLKTLQPILDPSHNASNMLPAPGALRPPAPPPPAPARVGPPPPLPSDAPIRPRGPGPAPQR